MPKIKTNRGATKRFARTASGNFKRAQSFHRHILTKKSSKRKRQLGNPILVHASDNKTCRRMLPYS
jgi:large subunit ribosomal protein L35